MNRPLDDTLRVLADPERRGLLYAFLDHDPPSAGSVAIPDEVPTNGAPEADVNLRMHHVHLPMLEEAGLVEWQREDEVVTTGPAFDDVQPLLQRLADADADPTGGSDGG